MKWWVWIAVREVLQRYGEKLYNEHSLDSFSQDHWIVGVGRGLQISSGPTPRQRRFPRAVYPGRHPDGLWVSPQPPWTACSRNQISFVPDQVKRPPKSSFQTSLSIPSGQAPRQGGPPGLLKTNTTCCLHRASFICPGNMVLLSHLPFPSSKAR